MFHRWHFCHRKKGVQVVGKTKRGKGTKIMAVEDRSGLPIAVSVNSASLHEIILVEPTLEAMFTEQLPERLIADKAYDSDPLDEKLAKNGVELIVLHRPNRKMVKIHDGRKLRWYHR
jgi:IS5 family transposase